MSFLGNLASGSAQRNAAIMGGNFVQQGLTADQGYINSGLANALQSLSAYGTAGQNTLASVFPSELNALIQGYTGAQGDVTGGYGTAIPSIEAGYNAGVGQYQGGLNAALQQLYGGMQQGQSAIQGGINQGSNYINAALGGQTGALNQGYGAAAGTLGGQAGQYNPYTSVGQGVMGSLANALGLGGPAGTAQAIAQFQAAPGYQAQQQAAQNAVIQHASATGMQDSGNTLTALQDAASNVANQNWNAYLGNLSNTAGLGLNALSGQSGLMSSLANTFANQGQGLSNVYGQAGNTLANMAYGGGGQLGQMAYGAGQGAAGLTTGAYGNIANALINQGNAVGTSLINQGNTLANLSTGFGQNYANAYNQFGTQNVGLDTWMGGNMANQYATATGQQLAAQNFATQQMIPLINSGMMAGQQASMNELSMLGGGLGMLGNIFGMGIGGGQTLGGSLIGKLFGS